jgi:hypothetical protein
MQPPKRRTPKDNFAEYGLRLLEDGENSTNPEFIDLRKKYIAEYFNAHLKANAPLSPRAALSAGLVAIVVLAAVATYSAMEQTRAVFILVLVVCLLFAALVILFVLALSGRMRDTVVGKVLLGIIEKAFSLVSRDKGQT